MSALNKCRLFLQAYYLSDLTDGSGTYITDEVWNGRNTALNTRQKSWPSQGHPTRSAWEYWRKFLKLCFFGRGLKITEPLGSWLYPDEHWMWYFAPSDIQFYRKLDKGWMLYQKIPHIARRPMFRDQGTYTKQTPILHRATAYERGNKWICSGYGVIKKNISSAIHLSFQDFLQASLQGEAWCFDSVEISGDRPTKLL